MPHEQSIPSSSVHWEHTRFQGRRIGSPGDGNNRRYWGVLYAPFASSEAAAAYPQAQPVRDAIPCQVCGNLVDTFFWHPGLGQYTMNESQVGACIAWMLAGNPTQAQADILAAGNHWDNLVRARAAMAGAEMFGGAFTVTAMPDERAEEE